MASKPFSCDPQIGGIPIKRPQHEMPDASMRGTVGEPSDKVSEHNVEDGAATGDYSWNKLGRSEGFPEGPGLSSRVIHWGRAPIRMTKYGPVAADDSNGKARGGSFIPDSIDKGAVEQASLDALPGAMSARQEAGSQPPRTHAGGRAPGPGHLRAVRRGAGQPLPSDMDVPGVCPRPRAGLVPISMAALRAGGMPPGLCSQMFACSLRRRRPEVSYPI